MYENWKFERWETPISNERLSSMISLVDDGEKLSIIIGKFPESNHVKFVFKDYPAYRNIQELYRTELWNKLYHRNLGSTLIIPQSEWIASFKNEVLKDNFPDAVHYMICTEDGCIEVISDVTPEIIEIEAK